MSKRWYVVHVYSGMEKSVHKALVERIERAGLQTSFGRILVPSEEVVEIKGGKKSISERRIFPGYVLVEVDLTDETWHLVKNTNRVTGFLGGSGNRPAPISEKEVEKILSQMEEGVEKPKQIGRAHVCTPATNAKLVCRHLLDKKKTQKIITKKHK